MSFLRKILRKNASKSQYIETIPKRGYRFTADVKEAWDNEGDLVVEQHVRARLVIEEEEETSGQGRDEWLLYLEIDPRLDSLRSDLRFRDLLRRMDLAA